MSWIAGLAAGDTVAFKRQFGPKVEISTTRIERITKAGRIKLANGYTMSRYGNTTIPGGCASIEPTP